MQFFVVFVHRDKFGIALGFLVGKLLFQIFPVLRVQIGVLQLLFYARNLQSEQFSDGGFAVHQLRHFIRFRIRHAHHAPHVLDNGARSEGTERYDLRHVGRLVFLPYVLYGFVAALRAEVHVEVGHGNAVGV